MIWCIRGSRYSVLHKMTRPEIRSILRAGDKKLYGRQDQNPSSRFKGFKGCKRNSTVMSFRFVNFPEIGDDPFQHHLSHF